MAGQTAVQQPLVQIPASVPSGTVLQAQAPSSQPSAVPMVTPQTQQYQWYQQVTPVASNPAVSTPQLLQNTSFQGRQQLTESMHVLLLYCYRLSFNFGKWEYLRPQKCFFMALASNQHITNTPTLLHNFFKLGIDYSD